MTEITKERRDAMWGSRPTPTEAAAQLRAYAEKMRHRVPPNDNIFTDAATVIDRLLDALDAAEAKMGAEPVAFEARYRKELVTKTLLYDRGDADAYVRGMPNGEVRPLYAAPPAAEPVVPEGWVLVPRDPTEEMIDEIRQQLPCTPGGVTDRTAAAVYAAMLAAAPALTTSPEPSHE